MSKPVALKEKAPAYQWYPKDWQSDSRVRRMTYEQRGIYRELLDIQWLEGSLPDDAQQLAEILGCPLFRFEKAWPLIRECFTVRDADQRLLQMRLERQRLEHLDFIRKQRVSGRKGAAKRWHRGRDGDPNGLPM